MPTRAESVLTFWFGDHGSDAEIAEAQAALWWGKIPDTDDLIRTLFAPLRTQAINGALARWTQTPRSRLALIILVDQFSRNLFRDDPRAFANDALAWRWCIDGLALGHDQALRPIERVFFYLPLEHSERLDDQQRALALFTALRDSVAVAEQKRFDYFVDFSRRHCEVIARFGRFPHRNAVLGRLSTPAELEFLAQPGSSF